MHWQSSSIRNWLNNEFFETAFTDEERTKIITNESTSTEQEVTVSDTIGTILEETSCKDKVFLLSMKGLEGNLENKEILGVITPYAQYESKAVLSEAYDNQYEVPTTDTYNYAIYSYATRDTIHVDLSYASEGNIVYSANSNFGVFYGATPFVGLGIRPCIWVAK